MDSQKSKRRKHKHNVKGNHQTTKGETNKGTKKKYKINWKTRFKMATNTYLSIITLKISGLNAPIKRHRVGDWIKKPRAYNMLPTKDTHRLKMKG